VLDAIEAIEAHLAGGTLGEGVIFDAVRMRLLEIGEAVNAVDPAILAAEPGVPWRDIATMRNWLAHCYFDTAYAVVAETVRHDLAPLAEAARRLLQIA
jgi:uncharacterized protein with HEPN domain